MPSPDPDIETLTQALAVIERRCPHLKGQMTYSQMTPQERKLDSMVETAFVTGGLFGMLEVLREEFRSQLPIEV